MMPALRSAVCAILTLAAAATDAHTQSQLRVLRHTPGDSATPGEWVTVMFDRPVAGAQSRSIDPRRIMRIEPRVSGRMEWRDPVTLRLMPSSPLVPGRTYTVVIDTNFSAADGARLATPYRFTVRIPGPTPLSHATGPRTQEYGKLAVRPRLRVLYSSPVNLAEVEKLSRIEFNAPCPVRTVRLSAVRQRPVYRSDGFHDVGGGGRDTTADRLRRIVELTTNSDLPDGCGGLWHIPSFDPRYRDDAWRYRVATPGPFTLLRPSCSPGPLCEPGYPSVSFSTPPAVADIQRYVRIDSGRRFTVGESAHGRGGYSWFLRTESTNGAAHIYRITIDTALRDVYGRRLSGTHTRLDTVGNFAARLTVPVGVHTITRNTPGIRVGVMNVDTLTVSAIPIPEVYRLRMFSASSAERSRLYHEVLSTELRDTIRVDVPVSSPLDVQHSAVIPLPDAVRSDDRVALWGILVSIKRGNLVSPELRRGDGQDERVRATGGSIWNLPFPILLQRSELSAHTMLSGDSGAVFVTRTAGGGPVAGASLTLFDARGDVRARGTTDPEGLGVLRSTGIRDLESTVVRDPDLDRARVLEVVSGGDRVLMAADGALAGSSWNAVVRRGGRASPARGVVITDRDIYRPGEMLYAKVIARTGTLGALTAPAGDSLRLSLTGGGGRTADTLWRKTVRLSPFGTVSDSITISPGARLGAYSLVAELRTQGRWIQAGNAGVRVEEYRAPDFRATITTDTVHAIVRDSASVTIKGEYLFGQSMAGASVRWTAQREARYAVTSRFAAARGFTIGFPWGFSTVSGLQNRGDAAAGTDTLSTQGTAVLRIPVQAGSGNGPLALRVTATVIDANNQTVTTVRSVPLPQPELYVGARMVPVNQQWMPGARRHMEVIALDSGGAPRDGLTLRMLVQHTRCRPDTSRNAYPDAQRCVTDTVSTSRIVTQRTPVTVSYAPPAPGRYDFIFQTTGRTPRAQTALPFNNVDTVVSTYSGAQVPAAKPFSVSADTGVLIPGQTALVRVHSPFAEADAWITKEREGVFEQRRVTVREGITVIPVVISESDAPAVYVGVTLLRRGLYVIPGADSVYDLVRAGSAHIRVDASHKRLLVDVSPRDSVYEPGAVANIDVKVNVMQGERGAQPMRSDVALWAVDEGVLSLTGFRSPDLFAQIQESSGLGALFRSQLLHGAWTVDYGRDVYIQIRNPLSMGGAQGRQGQAGLFGRALTLEIVVATGLVDPATGAALDSSMVQSLRSNFRTTAFFLGEVRTNDAGLASVQVKLPDNLTTFRIMAIATTDADRYGSDTSSVMTTRPLVVRPALPRFVRFGDVITATALVNTRERGAEQVRIRFSPQEGAMQNRDSSVFVKLTPNGTAQASFPLSIPAQAQRDVTRMNITASSGVLSDAMEATLPIKPDRIPRTHTVIGSVSDSVRVELKLPADIDRDRSRASIRFGTSPISAIRSNYERLRDYPYRTSEQIAGAGSALIALSRAEEALGIRTGSIDASVQSDLQRAADELARRESGGWIHLWPNPSLHNSTGPWLTTYAGTFLLNAERAGVTVRQSLMTELRETMGKVARDSIEWLRPDTVTGSRVERNARFGAWLGARVAALRFIREAGAPDSATENRLLQFAPRMSWEDRVILAELLAVRGDAARARAMLEVAWSGVSLAGARIDLADSLRGAGTFPSHIRPAARLFSATLRIMPAHPMLGALAETIIQQGRAEQSWAWNTQDYAAAATALSDLAVRQTGGGTRRVMVRTLDGRELITRTVSLDAADTSIALNGLLRAQGDSSVLGLVVAGDGGAAPIYFAVDVVEIPLAPSVTPDVRGIAVERWFEDFNTGRPVAEVREGDLVRVRLQVTVPSDRQFVALEDLLPAGLEVIDLSLRTSGTLGPFATNAESQRLNAASPTSGSLLQRVLYGSYDSGWWSPWEYKELRDDRVMYFARQLFGGVYSASYVARATTPGRFVLPPAHAEEMFNRALQGRSGGGAFVIRER